MTKWAESKLRELTFRLRVSTRVIIPWIDFTASSWLTSRVRLARSLDVVWTAPNSRSIFLCEVRKILR
jgi:hypothetical protein